MWKHQCRLPGSFRIWVKQARAGAQWECDTCGENWTLHRRNPTGHYAFWEWRTGES